MTVTFTVTGANPQSGTGITNESGEATFTYKGEHAGTDTIVASFEDKAGKTDESNPATKIWTEEGPPPPTCTSAKGEARFVRGAEAQSIVDNVSTNLSNPQVLKFRWENGAQQLTLTNLLKATCKVGAKQKTFKGSGLATVDGVENVHFTFAITVTNRGGVKIIVQFKEEKETIHFKNAARLDQEIS